MFFDNLSEEGDVFLIFGVKTVHRFLFNRNPFLVETNPLEFLFGNLRVFGKKIVVKPYVPFSPNIDPQKSSSV
jgi:hypothetical protein